MAMVIDVDFMLRWAMPVHVRIINGCRVQIRSRGRVDGYALPLATKRKPETPLSKGPVHQSHFSKRQRSLGPGKFH